MKLAGIFLSSFCVLAVLTGGAVCANAEEYEIRYVSTTPPLYYDSEYYETTTTATTTTAVEPFKIISYPITMHVGEKGDFIVSWDENDAIVIHVSDTSIVKGTIQLEALKAGTVTVTVQSRLTQQKEMVQIDVLPNETALLEKGDANGDGSIDILDVIAVNKALLGKEVLTEAQKKASDINGNSVPDSTDALMILKYIISLVKTL